MGFPKTGLYDGYTRSHADGRRWMFHALKGVWKIKQEINQHDNKYKGTDGFPFAQVAKTSDTTTTLTIDNNSTNFKVNLTGNTTIEFETISGKEGTSGTIALMQDGTGGHTFTLPSTFKTPVGGAAITQVTSPNSVSILSYYVLDDSNVLVNYIGDFS